jgi:hypothetical protein
MTGPRFQDLRHSYATWLAEDAVPINDPDDGCEPSLVPA